MTARHLTGLLLGVSLLGCNKGASPPGGWTVDAAPAAAPVAVATPAPPVEAAPVDAAPAAVEPTATTGTITGVIKLEGAPPDMPLLDRSRDGNCPQGEARATYVSVGAGGALRGAVVHLPVGVSPPGAPRPPAAVVDQKECVYRPGTVAVVAGQGVKVKNSDPTTHNVRGVKDGENLFNKIHMASAPDLQLPVDAAAGQAVELRCDIHPWMHTWVYVHDSGWFAVTGADGKFTLPNLPPGSYEVEVWHPYLGTKKSKKLVVEAGKTVAAELPAYAVSDYKAPAE